MTETTYHALIVDTETTGVGNSDQVIEFAYLTLPTLPELQSYTPIYAHPSIDSHSSRWKPSVPINERAFEVHKISLTDLADCPPSEDLQVPSMNYFIAHNASFDHRMLGAPAVKRICTMELAKLLWKKEEVGNFKLTNLIETLVEDGAELVLEAHSALSDCYLALILLQKILDRLPRVTTWEELYTMQLPKGKAPGQAKTKVIAKMPFGKYAGEMFCDIPKDYLQWLLKQDIQKPLEEAVQGALGFNSKGKR